MAGPDAEHGERDSVRVAAVDLGASSGRVVVVDVGPDRLELTEVHRFPNAPTAVSGHLHWDVRHLYREVVAGLLDAASTGPVDGIGIDSWAVDYGLLNRDGELLGDPYSYRDHRTDGVGERVAARYGAAALYATNGLQQLPFTTLYQLAADPLVADRDDADPGAADTLLLLPDLLAFWLTGQRGTEHTNASTTGLYDARLRSWAPEVARRVGVPEHLLTPLRYAGEAIGPVLPEVHPDLAGIPVIAVGSHDTASAVVGAPGEGEHWAYLSSGTWSLVGLELTEPVLTEAARAADLTNEAGVDRTVRFLKNVMGLWVLSQSLEAWTAAGDEVDLADLLDRAERCPPLRTVVDIDDPRLLPPGDMPTRLADLAREGDQPVPRTRAETVRCILDSLALAYRRRLREAADLAGRRIEVLHVVGGGARNRLLCQLTADACGVPVLAGPVEASVLGNALVQARSLGVDLPDLAAMRRLLRATQPLDRYEPRSAHPPAYDDPWTAHEARMTGRPQTGAAGQREETGTCA